MDRWRNEKKVLEMKKNKTRFVMKSEAFDYRFSAIMGLLLILLTIIAYTRILLESDNVFTMLGMIFTIIVICMAVSFILGYMIHIATRNVWWEKE